MSRFVWSIVSIAFAAMTLWAQSSPAVTQAPTGPLEQKLAIAQQLYVNQEWDGAIEALNQALRMTPKSTAALIWRGMCYLAKGDSENATKDLRAVIKNAPRSADARNAHRLQQQILEKKGDLDGALKEIGLALAIKSDEGIDYHTRAKLKVAKGDLDGAIADYDKAISLVPRAPAFYDNRGLARRAKGDLDGAIADFDKALEINPLQAAYAVHRGDARKSAGDLDGALADYNQALAWHLAYAPAHVQRGLLKLARGDDAEAQKDFDFALRLDPSLKASMDKAIAEVKAKR